MQQPNLGGLVQLENEGLAELENQQYIIAKFFSRQQNVRRHPFQYGNTLASIERGDTFHQYQSVTVQLQ